jgi:ribonuclease BN (tRNA processing enzyme)
VRSLVLTHIPPWTDPEINLAHARAAYAGPVALAAPGATYEV